MHRPSAALPDRRPREARVTRAPARRTLAALVLAAGAAGLPACTSPTVSPQKHDLAVVVTPPSGTFAPGDGIKFTVTVTNDGPGDSGAVTLDTIAPTSCAAAGNAQCPDAVHPDTLDNVPAGGRVTFTYKETLPADGLGIWQFAFSATSQQDTDTTNDGGSFSITMIESRNATYHLFAADGRTYDLALDFTHAQWTLSGNGADGSGTLTSEDAGGTTVYLFGKAGRLHTVPVGVVGQADFGAGPMPFAGSRNWATSPYFLNAGTYTLLGRDWSGSAPVPVVETATMANGVMSLCATARAYQPADCPAADLATYQLTLAGPEITAVNTADAADVQHFRLGTLGTQWFLLRADTDPAGVRHFRVGLQDDDGPAADTYAGGDTLGHWDAVTLGSGSTWDLARPAPDDTAGTESGTWAVIDPLAPTGLRLATRASDGATFLLAQGDVLAVMSGTAGGTTATDFRLLAR